MKVWLSNRWRRDLAICAIPAAIVLLAAGVRLAYWLQLAQTPMAGVAVGPDVQEYDGMARDILGRGLLWPRLQPHAPLYPSVLALFCRVTGGELLAVRGLQLALDVLSLVLGVLALDLLGRRRTGLWFGFLWALYLPLVYYSGELLCEGTLVLCLSAAFLCWALAWRAQQSGARARLRLWLLAMGVALGGAVITHPLCLGAVLGALLGVALWQKRQAGPRAGRAAACLAVAGLALAILPVALRNYVVSGECVLVQARGGFNLYIGNNPEATGTCYLRPGAEYERLLHEPGSGHVDSEGTARRYYFAKVYRFVGTHPWTWLRLVCKKLLLTWNSIDLPSGSDLPELQQATPLMGWPLVRFGLVAPLAFAGLSLCRRRPEWGPGVVFVVGYSLTLGLLVTSGRYRLGMVPAVLLLAASGISDFTESCQRQEPRRLLAFLLWVLLGVVVVIVPVPPRVTEAREFPLALATAAMLRGDYASVEAHATYALAVDPDSSHAHHFLALAAEDKGKWPAAERHYRQALRLHAGNHGARVDYAVFLSGNGQPGPARRELARTVRESPEAGGAWYNLGVIEEAAGHEVLAADHYAWALQCNGGQTSAHLNLALLLQRQGDRRAALSHFRAAVRLAPDKLNALNALALFQAEEGEEREARTYFERSLAQDPHQVEIWCLYISFLQHLRDALAASEALARARRANPSAPELWPPPQSESPGATAPASQSPSPASQPPASGP